jgi:GNAT superfamily N-acetyltransferase
MVESDFIAQRTTDLTMGDGSRVRLRPIVPEDKAMLADGFAHLSEESRYRRFAGAVSKLTPAVLRYLTEIDYTNHFAWVAFSLDEPGRPGLGVARYVRLRDEPAIAEAAVAVADHFHGRGLGTLLLEALGAVALENGISAFRAFVLADNTPMLDILNNMGARFAVDSPGQLRADIDLPEQMEKLKQTSLYATLRAAARGEITPRTPPALFGRPLSPKP